MFRVGLSSWVGWVVVVGLLSAPECNAGGWADRLFTETGHDFGAVPRGAKVRHNFVLHNNLNEALTVLDVRASCGCTTGRALSREAKPGESVLVEAEMDTRNFVGRKATVLFVSLVTAAGTQSEARLNVASMILSDVVLNPGSLDFGVIAAGQTPSLTLTIDRINSPNWRIERMVSSCKAIEASCTEVARNAQVVSYRLKVGVKPGASAESFRDEIRISTNDPESPMFPIPITGTLRRDLSASPSVISLGNIQRDRNAEGKYLVRASKPFKIDSIEGVGDGFELMVDNSESRPVHLLNLQFRADANTSRGDLHRTFQIKTDLAGEPPLSLSATAHLNP